MSLTIDQIAEQEDRLTLPRFDEDVALELGLDLVRVAHEQKAPVVIDIRTPDATLFHVALKGSCPDNDEWARRKSNVCLRRHKSSMRSGLEFDKIGLPDVHAHMGMDLADYATHGGSFPVRLTGGRVVAAITVSGLASIDDHMMVVEALERLIPTL